MPAWTPVSSAGFKSSPAACSFCQRSSTSLVVVLNFRSVCNLASSSWMWLSISAAPLVGASLLSRSCFSCVCKVDEASLIGLYDAQQISMIPEQLMIGAASSQKAVQELLRTCRLLPSFLGLQGASLSPKPHTQRPWAARQGNSLSELRTSYRGLKN